MAKPNPVRFSTKYQDDETDLLYYGFRYYSASMGRWLSRDPIGEYAFVENTDLELDHDSPVNPYCFVDNCSVNKFDILGLKTQKEAGAAALSAAAGKMKEMCTKCIACTEEGQPSDHRESCGITKCQRDAQMIVDAIVSKWNLNFGRGHNRSGDNVGGYLCWDWAEGFLKAASSVDSKCWQKLLGHALRSSDTEVHFWIYLQAGSAWQGSGDRAKQCTIMVDDGWFDGSYIHAPKWPDDPAWQIGKGTRGPLTSPPML